jgi:hypothetical protein
VPDSKAQVRAAYAAASGSSTIGMDPDFAREVVSSMKGRKMASLPERKGPMKVPKRKKKR